MDMNASLQELLEKQAIVERLNRLFVATDLRDWVAVRECFAPKVHFDMSSLSSADPVTKTPEQIADSWDEGLRVLTAIHHQTGNFLVAPHGQTADAFCYGIALHYLPNPSGRNTRTFVGSYDFHLTKDGKRWRIDRFKFTLKYMDGNGDLEGSAA